MKKNTKIATKTMPVTDTKLIVATLVALAAGGFAFALSPSGPRTLAYEPQGLSAQYAKQYTYQSDSCVLKKTGTEKVCVVDSKYANKNNWNDECYLQKVISLANNGNCDFVIFQPKLNSIEFSNTISFGNSQSAVANKKVTIDGGWGRTQKISMGGAKTLIQSTNGSKMGLAVDNIAMMEGSSVRLNNVGDHINNVMLEFGSNENNSKDILLSGKRTGANEFIGSIFSVEGGKGMASGGGQASLGGSSSESGFVYVKYSGENGWSVAVEGTVKSEVGQAKSSVEYALASGDLKVGLEATEGLFGVSGGVGFRKFGQGETDFAATGNVGSAMGFLNSMFGDNSQSKTVVDASSDNSQDQNKNNESQNSNTGQNSQETQSSDQTAKNEETKNNDESANSNDEKVAENKEAENNDNGTKTEEKNNSSEPYNPDEMMPTQKEYYQILVMLGKIPTSEADIRQHERGTDPMTAKERMDYDKIQNMRKSFGRNFVVMQINFDTLIGTIYGEDKELAVWMLKGKEMGNSAAATQARLEAKAEKEGNIDPAPRP